MPAHHRILLLDDDQELLDLYREVISMMPSNPEVVTADNGRRAMNLLETAPFSVLICDLKMPTMDGLQVLSIVRRKFPNLRTVVMTSVQDEHYRTRAYELGVDLYWQKPGSEGEFQMFTDCLESLLERKQDKGFRGVQSKSLIDLIQLECISQNSVVLKITNRSKVGTIWIDNGELIDAATDELSGEEAFHHILSWRGGGFESLPAEPEHPRNIHTSYQGLLLEYAQAFDEAQENSPQTELASRFQTLEDSSPLAIIARMPGVEFALAAPCGSDNGVESWGLEDSGPLAEWTRRSLKTFRELGEKMGVGNVVQAEFFGPQRHAVTAPGLTRDLTVGWQHSMSAQQVRESMKKGLESWAS